MRILLPPSEGKTPPTEDSGQRLDLHNLLLPQLAEARQQVLDALIALSGRDSAPQMLKVGATLAREVAGNQHLASAPVAPAWQIYTGVLFNAIACETLTDAQLQRASDTVLIFSGLFGATRFTDQIPAYRLAMNVKLNPFGTAIDPGALGSFWRRHLTGLLNEKVAETLVVDARSSAYTAAYRPPAQQTLMVNNFTERNGELKTVTHFAKQARGELTGMLLRSDNTIESIDDVAHVASQRWRVQLRSSHGKTPHQLDLINRA